jgi:C1A family cysteine protease
MPQPGEQVVGGHAVCAIGYDDKNQWFIVRNSWGPDWGMSGYFTLPYQYLLEENLSSDFWTIRMVESSSNGKSNGHSNGYANGKRMSGNGKKRKH